MSVPVVICSPVHPQFCLQLIGICFWITSTLAKPARHPPPHTTGLKDLPFWCFPGSIWHISSTEDCFSVPGYLPTPSALPHPFWKALGRQFLLLLSLSKCDPNNKFKVSSQITQSKKMVNGFVLITVFPQVNPVGSYGSSITLMTPILQSTKILKQSSFSQLPRNTPSWPILIIAGVHHFTCDWFH